MHHSGFFKKVTLSVLSALVAVTAHAEPNENVQETLTRTASSGMVLQSKLVKNAYRQEPYQAHYTVQIPYQAEETYYVDIPYQDTETYTDYETYTDSEYRCENYTDYERQCHNEQECSLTPNIGINRAADDVISRPRDPGGNPGPDPYEPPGPVRPTPVCRDRQVCDNVPVTRQRCGYESVQRQRPVTRTRTVTKYRQEARTRKIGRAHV